jgi:GT2 family glycosyltransferase
MLDVSVSIVLYRSSEEEVVNLLNCFSSNGLSFKISLVDNSPTDRLRVLKLNENIEYIFNERNLGFGRAHNIALRKSITEARYHLVLNPDIYFEPGNLEAMVKYLDENEDVGQLMPKVLYPSGENQNLCKLLPTPFDLVFRRFLGFLPLAKRQNRKYELIDSGYNKVMNIPYLSGCFMLLRTSVLKEIGFFDERIFMYIEDADLTRRIHQRYKTVFYPDATIYHNYAKGSYKNFKLMLYNMHGAIIYFTKWGWFFDKERVRINKHVLKKYC